VRTGTVPTAGRSEELQALERDWQVRPQLARLLEPDTS